MKKFNIQTIVLLFVVLAGFTSKSNAQFASSKEVYCYQYDYSVQDGVKSRDPSQIQKREYYFCIFYENWTNGLFATLERYRTGSNHYTFDGLYQNRQSYLTQAPHMVNCIYDAANSTSSYYTYHCPRSGSWYTHDMWSFSKDKSVFIYWRSDSNWKHYYKRIDVNSLKPNLDFLD